MSLTAFALTAGLGTRLRPYTEQRAKPTIPFLGVALVLHSLRHLESLPIEKLFLNLHHAAESVRRLDLSPLKIPTPLFSDETSQILGSGGSVARVIDQISTSQILLLNGDEVYLPRRADVLSLAFTEHERRQRVATLLTMDHPEVGRSLGGAWTDDNESVRAFSKTPIPGMKGHHYVGYLFLHRRVEKYFSNPVREENILYETLTRAISAGEDVGVYHHPAWWYETGKTDLFLQSSREVLQLIKDQKENPAVRDLLQFLRRMGTPEFLIEQSEPALRRQIEDLFTSLG